LDHLQLVLTRLGRSETAYARFEAVTDLPLTVLAVLWLPVLILPVTVDLSAATRAVLDDIDYLIWGVFVFEYVAKIYLAPSRRNFAMTHKLDLLVIAVPMLRPIRGLRVVRLLRLLRVGAIFADVLARGRGILTHRGLHFVLLAALLVVLCGAALVLGFEHHAHGSTIHDYGDALWWAIVTMATVGYGDKYPVTAGGRGVAVVLMLMGIGLLGVVTASVASFFVEQGADDDKKEILARLDRMETMLSTLTGIGRPSGSGYAPRFTELASENDADYSTRPASRSATHPAWRDGNLPGSGPGPRRS
jgi:voltage-gated potassium channel